MHLVGTAHRRAVIEVALGELGNWGVLKVPIITFLALAVAGCARASVMPLAQDTVQISSRSAPACGGAAAQEVAFQRAAVETIRRGYDRFVIVGGQAQTETRLIKQLRFGHVKQDTAQAASAS